MEINGPSFTKVLQEHTYNILHTSAACRKTFLYERLDSRAALICTLVIYATLIAKLLQETEQLSCQSTTLFYVSRLDLLIVGPSKYTYEVVRQTDGERFFTHRRHVEFAKDFGSARRRVRDT